MSNSLRFFLAESLLNELKKLTLTNDSDGIEATLGKLTAAENLQSLELKEAFLGLLAHSSPIVNLIVIKAIAEITKTPEQRTKFSNSEVLEKLIEMLDNALKGKNKPENVELMVQLCRALGNIFYSNDDSRNIVFHLDEGKVLINLFNVAASDIPDTQHLVTFAKVRSGVMSNYLLGNEELSQKAIDHGIIDKIKARMEEPEDLLEHLLPAFSILTEQVSDLIFKPEILQLITRILKTSTNSDVAEACLELLLCQAESDEVKLLLAKEGLCEHIFNSQDKYKTFVGQVEAKSLVKLTCDLIVLILTGGKFS